MDGLQWAIFSFLFTAACNGAYAMVHGARIRELSPEFVLLECTLSINVENEFEIYSKNRSHAEAKSKPAQANRPCRTFPLLIAYRTAGEVYRSHDLFRNQKFIVLSGADWHKSSTSPATHERCSAVSFLFTNGLSFEVWKVHLVDRDKEITANLIQFHIDFVYNFPFLHWKRKLYGRRVCAIDGIDSEMN